MAGVYRVERRWNRWYGREFFCAIYYGYNVNDTKYNAALSDLKLSKSDFDANGKGSIDAGIAWQKWAENKGYFDYYGKGGSSKLNKALWAECAYDLYWHDRTVKGVGWWPITVYLKDDGTVGMTEESYIPGAFAVSSDYKASDNTNDEYRQYYIDHPNYGTPPNWDVNTAKAKSTAKTTLTNAKRVVENAKSLSDYEKLEYYADYILKAVSYDNEAAKHIGDNSYELGNPWQVPYVFDDNASTNIVCEGYAKAFKFLCDMTAFEDSSIDVRLVTGPCNIDGTNEEHMWNVVTYSGKNYVVDLTNSDEGSVGAVGTLFMMPASYSSWAKTYNMNGIYYPSAGEEGQSASRENWSASYKYDDGTVETFADKDLSIAKELPDNYTDPKEAAKAIAQQMKDRKSRIVVQYTGSSSGLEGDTFTALRDLAYEHTGKAGVGDNLKRQVDSCVPATSGSSNVYIYNVECFNDAKLERQLETEAEKVIESLNLDGKSDYQKAKAIYNWLCRNVKYDEDRSRTNLQRYSAAYAIVKKNAVCEGYANAFYYLASMVGIENRIVVSVDHAWNIVKLGEYYYNVDATWDASYYDPDVYPNYGWRFFMKNDATYMLENYPSASWENVNPEHHTRLSYDTGDAEFQAEHPMSPTNYGETETGIQFKEDNGKIIITGYTGEASELVIPDQIAGEPIGTIKAKALASEKLTKITFAKDIETIEDGAFHQDVTLSLTGDCKNLVQYADEHNIKTEGVQESQEEKIAEAEKARDEAVRAQKAAEEARDEAIKAQQEAEIKAQEAKAEADAAKEAQKVAEAAKETAKAAETAAKAELENKKLELERTKLLLEAALAEDAELTAKLADIQVKLDESRENMTKVNAALEESQAKLTKANEELTAVRKANEELLEKLADQTQKAKEAEIKLFKALSVQKVKASMNTMYATVNWAVLDEQPEGYVVSYSTKKGSGYKELKDTDLTTLRTDVNLKAGIYYVKVRAYKTVDGEKIYSKYSSAVKVTCKTAAVTNVKVTATTKNAKVTWKKSNGMPTAYKVYYSTNKTKGFKSAGTAKTTVFNKNLKLKKGKTYYFKVRGYKKVGDKTVYTGYSKVVTVKIKK